MCCFCYWLFRIDLALTRRALTNSFGLWYSSASSSEPFKWLASWLSECRDLVGFAQGTTWLRIRRPTSNITSNLRAYSYTLYQLFKLWCSWRLLCSIGFSLVLCTMSITRCPLRKVLQVTNHHHPHSRQDFPRPQESYPSTKLPDSSVKLVHLRSCGALTTSAEE